MIGWLLLGCTEPPLTTTNVNPGDSGSPDPCDASSADVGTGLDAYVPLSSGDPLTVVFGPQGGWHIDVGARILGTEQIVSFTSELVLLEGEQSLTGTPFPTTLGLVPHETCGWTLFGIRAILDDKTFGTDPAEFVCGLDGQTARLELEVSDTVNDLTLADDVEVTLQTDPEQSCPGR